MDRRFNFFGALYSRERLRRRARFILGVCARAEGVGKFGFVFFRALHPHKSRSARYLQKGYKRVFSMGEFLKTWYGMTLFILFDAAAIVAVMAIGYRWIFKRLWDLAASVVSMAVLSPLYLAIFIRAKLFQKRTGAMKSILSREFFVGKKSQNHRTAYFLHRGRRRRRSGRIRALAEKDGILQTPLYFRRFLRQTQLYRR